MNYQYQKRKCHKGGQHHNRDIDALCLQQPCKNDRLLCFYCIHQNHQNHQIVYLLQGLDSPIEKLNINSQISHKLDHQRFLQRKIKKINQGWKNLYRVFESYINKIETNLEPQLAIIEQSFDQDSARRFAEVITNANTSQQMIDKHVQKIKLIMKYDLSNIDKVKVSTAVAYEELKQMYKQANSQIQQIMSKIVNQTNIFSTFNFSSVAKANRGKLGIDVTNRVSISIAMDKTTVDSFENRTQGKLIMKKVENRWLQKRNMYNSSVNQRSINKIITSTDLKQQNKDQIEQIQQHPEQQQYQQQKQQQQAQQQQQLHDNESSSSSQDDESASILKYKNFQYSQSQQSISPTTLNLNQIYLHFSTISEIQHYIYKIPPQSYLSVTSLQITCDTLPLAVNSQIINRIINFKSLKKLVICPAHGLQRKHLQSIITNLTQLQHLVLEKYYSLDERLSLLIKKKLPKLKKFNHYNYQDNNNNSQSYSQNKFESDDGKLIKEQ